MPTEMKFRRENAISNLGNVQMEVIQDDDDPLKFNVSFSVTLPDREKMAENVALLIHTITEAIVSFDETFEVKS